MTTQQILAWIAASPLNALQFLIGTHYEQILSRANTLGIVRGQVSEEDLYKVLTKVAVASPKLFAEAVDIKPDTSAMSDEAIAAFAVMLQSGNTPRMLLSQTGGASGGGSGSGPQAPSGGGSGFSLDSDTLTSLGTTGVDLANSIACWVDKSRCPQAPGGTVVVQQPPAATPTNYVPWIIGGIVALVVVVVLIVVVMRMGKK